jgi:transposase InsO family protein
MGKVPWVWTNACETAFQELKQRLITAPVLAYPDPSKTFYMFFDSSSTVALGGVLCQTGTDDDHLHPIAFESRKLTTAEKRYPVHELETLAFVHCLKRWRHYLDAKPFHVYTDNRSLETVMTNRNPSMRLIRWIDWLQSYQFVIKHIPREQNKVADALSMCKHAALSELSTSDEADVTMIPEMLSVLQSTVIDEQLCDSIRKLYVKDPTWSSVYENLRIKLNASDDLVLDEGIVDDPATDDYLLTDGLLWEAQEPHRLVLPSDKKVFREVMAFVHDSAAGGHLGVAKTLDRLNEQFYLQGAAKHVRKYIASCDSCQKSKLSSQKPSGLLQPLQVPEGRWTSVSMDFVTGLPRTKRGFDAITVFVDRFTKRAHFAASKSTDTAEDVSLLLLNEVVRHHGFPCSIVSDRDARFTSKFWESLMALLKIERRMSTSMHPQTDGQTERMNRTMEEMLRHYVGYQMDDWDLYLPAVEFAYNSSTQASTKWTPFEADIGRKPDSPMIWNGLRIESSSNQRVDTLIKKLDEIAVKIKENIKSAQERQKAFYDKGHREVTFNVGDQVLLDRSRLNLDAFSNLKKDKLKLRWLGPFEILERIGKVAYRLKLPPSSNAHSVFHVSALKTYVRADDGRSYEQPGPIIVKEQEEYEVEEVMDERVRRRRKEYLVRWRGYSLEDATWEPLANLRNASTVLEDYLKKCQSRATSKVARENVVKRGRSA